MLITLLLAVTLATPPQPEAPIAFTPEAVVWGDGPPSLPPGSKSAILEGHPRNEGMFTMRIRVPAGAALAPHWHPRHERVTILSGAVELGFGSVANTASVVRYGAGSFYVNPPRVMHYVYFPEATELQITGHGPWEIHTTDIAPPHGEKSTATVVIRNITPPAGAELTAATELVANVVKQEMEAIFRDPQLKRPIRMRIYVHEQNNDSSSIVAGMSDWIEYR
jgi:hypothetical protein